MTPKKWNAASSVVPLTILSLVFVSKITLAQSVGPALFATDHITINPQFNNFAGVHSYTINGDGTLNPVGVAFTNEFPYELSLSPNGRWLAVGHASELIDEDLIIFQANPDTTLTMFAVETVQSSPFEIDWIDNETLVLLETDGFGSGVWTYHFDPNAPIFDRLTPIDVGRTTSYAFHLALHPNKQFVYVADSPLFGTNTIFVFEISPEGLLTEIQTVFVAEYALDMVITPDGRNLYMASGTGNAIQAFIIDENTGMLTPQNFSPFPTFDGAPSNLAVTEGGELLIVFSGNNEVFRSYFISPDDGSIFDTFNSVDIGGSGINESIEVRGETLYVTRNRISDQIPAGILTYQIDLDTGAFTQLGDTIPGGTRPYFMESWTVPEIIPGDVNGDQVANLLDIPAFVAALLGQPFEPEHLVRADINQSGSANGEDTQPFIDILLFVPAMGACCSNDFALCQVVTENECMNVLEGNYQGDDTTCEVCPAIPAPMISFVGAPLPPFCNTDGNIFSFAIFGENFSTQASVVFRQTGFPDVLPTNVVIFDANTISGEVDLSFLQTGPYRLVVTNPDGQSVESPESYNVVTCP